MLDALLAADAALLKDVLSLPHPGWLNWLFLAASRAGVGGSIWLACGLALLLTHRIHRSGLVRLILAIVLAHLVVDFVLKPGVGRLRPPVAIAGLHTIGDEPQTASFPSGHAANSAAAAMVGIARVYLGAHYPLDAAAGAIVGLLCGAAALAVPLPRRARSGDQG